MDDNWGYTQKYPKMDGLWTNPNRKWMITMITQQMGSTCHFEGRTDQPMLSDIANDAAPIQNTMVTAIQADLKPISPIKEAMFPIKSQCYNSAKPI